MASLTLAEAELIYARRTGVTVKAARKAILQGIERGDIDWDPSIRIAGTNTIVEIQPISPSADSPIDVQSFERFLDVRLKLLVGESSSTEAAPWKKPVEEIEAKREHKAISDLNSTDALVSRGTLLDMVLGMAIDAYRYDPDADRNPASGEKRGSIKAALERVGITLDADTIRKALAEAKTNHRKSPG